MHQMLWAPFYILLTVHLVTNSC